MKNERIIAVDAGSRISVTAVDCTAAAADLARAHLSGPTASTYLAQALAGAALLGAETSIAGETVIFRLDCPGPLEGWLVECTWDGTLRGYTKKKILDDFDGGRFKDADVIGPDATVSIVRSVPGKVLSSGSAEVDFRRRKHVTVSAASLDAYFGRSLQRRVRTAFHSAAGDDGVPSVARGVMVECPPDGDVAAFADVSAFFDDGTAAKALGGITFSARTLMRKLGLALASIRSSTAISFACRCSRERAQNIIAALPRSDRESLPPSIDVTCHLCGRTWVVPNAGNMI